MNRFCFILNYWYWYWYWYWAYFGISLVTYYFLIRFFGIDTLFSIDPVLFATIIPIKVYSNR